MNALHPNFRWLERGEGEPAVLRASSRSRPSAAAG